MDGARAKLTDVNPHLVCVLCHGYFVDATTIAECLHSFCRSCIFRHLERKPICPICEVAVHNTKLHRSLRPDKTLQDIVYKLVPGLYRNEMQRRREFYKQHPFRDEYLEPECRGVGLDRVIYSPDDLISLSLEFYDEDREREEWNNNNVILKPVPIKKSPPGSKRFLQCPAGFKIKHIKKFIRQKCGLSDTCEVEVIYRKESLPDSYSLMDIAYIYTWKKNEPMRFYYKLPDSQMNILDPAKALASCKIVKEPPDTPEELKSDVQPSPKLMDAIPDEKPASAEILNGSGPDKAERKKDDSNTEPLVNGAANVKSASEPPKIGPDELKSLAPQQVTPITEEVPFNKPATKEAQPQPVPSPVVVNKPVVTNVPTSASLPPQLVSTVPPVSRAMTKQDELPVSVLLSLGNCTPEMKHPPLIDKPKLILPKPENKPAPIVDQLLNRKLKNSKANSKASVNKIAADLAENKGVKNVFKVPAPFLSNPLMLKTLPGSKLADPAAGNRTPFYPSPIEPAGQCQTPPNIELDTPVGNKTPYHRPMIDPAPGNRTPFHHSQTPQHLPVYPPPMSTITKTVPWKTAIQGRNSLFPQSPRHVPQYPPLFPAKDSKQSPQARDAKKPSQDPFLFQSNDAEPSKPDSQERVNGVGNLPSVPKQSSLPSLLPGTKVSSNIDGGATPECMPNGTTNHKTDRPEVTVKTSNGSLTISTQLPRSTTSPKKEETDGKDRKLAPPQVMHKNLSEHHLNGNGLMDSGPNKKKPAVENSANIVKETKIVKEIKIVKEVKVDEKNVAGQNAGNKNLSLSRKNHSGSNLIPGGVVSKTGPTLDQRLQQLYKSNSRPVNGTLPAQKTLPNRPPQSRLASWLNNRFNGQNKPPSPSNDRSPRAAEGKDKSNQESPTAKLGKEMSMLKKKLDELRKTAEGCEITQENPNPDSAKKLRDVTPNVSIELMKAADMKKLEINNKTKDKAAKRPVPGLKAIQDVDVKKIKLSPEQEELKKPKSEKGDEALDLSGAGKPSDELAHRIALLQKNGALSNQQQFNWLLNRPLIAGQQFSPRSS